MPCVEDRRAGLSGSRQSPAPPQALGKGEPSQGHRGCAGQVGESPPRPTDTVLPGLCPLRLHLTLEQPACVIKAARAGNSTKPLPPQTIILQADNEDRTAIQKNAWLWRLRTCPNCTCRFSFPGAAGPWLCCTCRGPAPCLSVTYLVLGVQAPACSASCSALTTTPPVRGLPDTLLEGGRASALRPGSFCNNVKKEGRALTPFTLPLASVFFEKSHARETFAPTQFILF